MTTDKRPGMDQPRQDPEPASEADGYGFSSGPVTLARQVDVLFGEVENSVQRSVVALVEGDEALARAAIEHDDVIDRLTVSLEESVIESIAEQAPGPTDLRYLLSVLRISSDLERCGDLALRVAKQVFDQAWIARAEGLRPYIRHLGDAALHSLMMAAQAWADRDETAWRKIEEADFGVDADYAEIVQYLRGLGGPHTGEIAVNSLIAAQALERIGDHSVSIAHRIRFLVTGERGALVDGVAP